MKMSRRTFIHGAAGTALAFPAIVPARVLGKEAPSNTIHVAQVGCGRIGLTMDVPGFLRAKGARIVAACDLDARRLGFMRAFIAKRQGEKSAAAIFGARDFHDVISRADVDAVSISTPDRYVDPKTGHGIEVKMLAPLEAERIYAWSNHCFANPMPIYEKPLELNAGETFALDYEVTVF